MQVENTTDRKSDTSLFKTILLFKNCMLITGKTFPNRYSSGSVINIDGEKGQIKVNNQIRLDDEIFGNDLF